MSPKRIPCLPILHSQHTKSPRGRTTRSTRLANPPLSPVKSRREGAAGSRTNVRILEGRVMGLPFLFPALRRRRSWVSREAVVWKKFPGSLDTDMVLMIDVDAIQGLKFRDHGSRSVLTWEQNSSHADSISMDELIYLISCLNECLYKPPVSRYPSRLKSTCLLPIHLCATSFLPRLLPY